MREAPSPLMSATERLPNNLRLSLQILLVGEEGSSKTPIALLTAVKWAIGRGVSNVTIYDADGR
jgi:hypothetical protein